MNRLQVGLISSGLGVLGGVLLSFGEAERRARNRYDESFESVKRAMERAQTVVHVHAPAKTEEELIEATPGEALIEGDKIIVPKTPVGGDLTREDEEVPEYVNHYQKALAAKDTPLEQFVDGGINDYGVSYIEEEDYDEDDGRFKGQVTLVMDGPHPHFFMDGVEIKDWDERLGDSILVDFYQFVPPEGPPVLYVRNHKRDEDYEVTREMP